MKKEHIFLIFILFLTFLSFYLLYQILSPFLESILWSILLAIIFYPVFKKIRQFLRNRGVFPAMLMTLLVFSVIVVPFSFLMVALLNEVASGYQAIGKMIQNGSLQAQLENLKESPLVEWIWTRLDQSIDLSRPIDFLLKNLQQISTFLFNQSSKIIKGLSTVVVGFFFSLLSLYYLFKDGDRLFEGLKDIVPIRSKERDLLIQRFQEMVSATIYGGLLIAVIQGTLGGLAFMLLGLSSPVLWGTAMALFSFIPMGGTALIWAPASIILLIQGAILKGITLLIIGVFGIGMVDNLLKPMFISSRTKIHPLLLFFAVLGGIQAFGLIGLVAGPLIATLCLTLIEIYRGGIHSSK